MTEKNWDVVLKLEAQKVNQKNYLCPLMKRKLRNSIPKAFVFTQWSGKSYATFASLKRVVNIGQLKMDLYSSVFGADELCLLPKQNGDIVEDEEERDRKRDLSEIEWLELLQCEVAVQPCPKEFEGLKFSFNPMKSIFCN